MSLTRTITSAASLFALSLSLPALAQVSVSHEDEPQWPQLELNARLMTGFEVDRESPAGAQRGSDETDWGLFLQQARVKLKIRANRQLRFNLSADLADALDMVGVGDSESIDRVPFLRNAYFNLKIRKVFQIRAGRYKLPFSRLENRSLGVLPITSRGLTNDLLVEDALWGDRAIGMMLWGDVKAAGLRWQLSASHLGGPLDQYEDKTQVFGDRPTDVPQNQEAGINLQARLQYEPAKMISVGLGGGYIFGHYDQPGIQDAHLGAFGADLRLKGGGFHFAAEGLLGERLQVRCSYDPTSTDYDCSDASQRETNSLGATTYLSYEVKLPRAFALRPVVFGEWTDGDLEYSKTEGVRGVIGVNLLWRELLRVMPQFEIVRPLGVVQSSCAAPLECPINPFESSETYSLTLSVQL